MFLGLHISVIVMDCPKGSVCRITQSDRAMFPLKPHVCSPQLIPIIELVYRTRLYLLETVKAIEEFNEVVSIGRKGKKRALLPPCITNSSGSSSTKSTTDSDDQSPKRQKH